MLTDETRLQLEDEAAFEWLDDSGQAVLVSLGSGQLYTCNETACSFLDAIDGRRTFGQIVDNLASEYEVAKEQLRSDLSVLADELIREKLVLVATEKPIENS